MYDKPLPEVDDDTRPFWDAARQHQLKIQRCQDCSRAVFYPRAVCPYCGSTSLTWISASGRGIVHSFTVARRPAGPAFAEDVPMVIALIDLEEGARMMSNLIAPHEEVRIGAAVEVCFDDVTPEITLPKFTLAADGQAGP